MGALYNYGISQEDVLSEYRALGIAGNDSLLCIASAGEIPLNMAALQNLNIVAVDNSVNQLRLCRIKQASALCLDSVKAASFLGYMDMSDKERQRIFNLDIRSKLSEEDCRFWDQQSHAIRKGVINAARFEQYIRKFSAIGRSIIGRKNLFRLFDCDSIEDQKAVFDQRVTKPLLKNIFKIAFHPTIYKNRGIDPAGLAHSGTRNIADFFFQRLRNFCCNTLASRNYYFQFTFFNRVLFTEALPEFLQPVLRDNFIKNGARIEFRLSKFDKALEESDSGMFNKLHLSNIGDWMSKEAMSEQFRLIRDKTKPGTRAVMRFIHLNHELPSFLPELTADYLLGNELVLNDRYPFYSIVPISRK